MPVIRCVVCGKKFSRPNCHINEDKNYCSRECHAIGIRLIAEEKVLNFLRYEGSMKELLTELYVERNYSLRELSKLFRHCDSKTLRVWMDIYGIGKRHGSEAIKGQIINARKRSSKDRENVNKLLYSASGDGYSPSKQEINQRILHTNIIRKGVIEEIDRNTCQDCKGVFITEDLDIHFIEGYDYNLSPLENTKLDNVMSLCNKCKTRRESNGNIGNRKDRASRLQRYGIQY